MKYQIGKNVDIIESEIGNYSTIGDNSKIFFSNIGKFCSISWNVTIGAPNHHTNTISTHNFPFTTFWGLSDSFNIQKVKTYIGNDVWIASNVVIISGIKIGNGVVVGANSVVTRDLEEYGIYAGNPAKLLRKRFDKEIIEILNKLKWWDLDKQIIKNNISFFKKENITKNDILKFMENIK